jgi:hypothetical protein
MVGILNFGVGAPGNPVGGRKIRFVTGPGRLANVEA